MVYGSSIFYKTLISTFSFNMVTPSQTVPFPKSHTLSHDEILGVLSNAFNEYV